MVKHQSRDAGFTLIELLMAIMLSGLLIGALSTGFIAAMNGTQGAHERFIATHGAQTLAAHFTSDVQSTMPHDSAPVVPDTDPSATTGCAPSSPADSAMNLLRLQWTEKKLEAGALTTTAFTASYRMQLSGTEWELARWFCSHPDGTPDAPSPQVVANDLGLTDGVTNGSTTFTSRRAAFSDPGDVGRTLVGTNVPPATTIVSVTDAKTVVMSAAATGSGSDLAFALAPTPTFDKNIDKSKVSLETYALNDYTSATRRSYTVSAHMRTLDVSAPGPSFKVTLNPPAPGPYTAGSTVTATIAATTDGAATDPDYIDDHDLTFITPSPSTSVYPTQPMTFTAGTWTGPVKFNRAETDIELVVSDGSITGASDSFTVKPAVPHHLTVTAPAGTTAGTPFDLTVTAKDQYENTATTGYARTVGFTSSDLLAGLPPDYTFTAADNGSHQFSVTLASAGSQTVTATDNASPARTDTATVTVTGSAAGSLNSFDVTAPTETTAGAAFTMKVTAKDALNNTVTNYVGTVQFTSSDTQAGLPASYTFVPADLGTRNFTVVLKSAGDMTVTVTDSAAAVIEPTTIKVNPAGAAKLGFTSCTINGGAPVICSNAAVGGNKGFMEGKVTLQDAYGNPVIAIATLNVDVTGGNSDFIVTGSPITIAAGSSESSGVFRVTHNKGSPGSATLSAQTTGVSGLGAGSMTVSN